MPTHNYPLTDGTKAPGGSTIANLLEVPALHYWIAKVTREGKDWIEERDSAGRAGTLAHALVMSYWTKEEVPVAGYTFEEIGQAYFCYTKFLHCYPERDDLEIIAIETPIISEELGCGGTPDILARVRSVDKIRRIDVKTGSGIYDTAWYQLAGYDLTDKQKADEHQILWLPKGEGFACPIRTDLRKEKKIFKHLLEIHKLRRE